MALTHQQVVDNVSGLVTGGSSLELSAELLDPRWAPEANLDRRFCLNVASISNTGDYRDKPGRQERAEYTLEIKAAWMLNVHNYSVTRDLALADSLAVLQAVASDTSASSRQIVVHHNSTDFEVHASREWLFATISFSVVADVELP